MGQRDRAIWLSLTLLLLCVPGSLPLTALHSVSGTIGSSLTVRCHYETQYKGYNKYWCRGPDAPDCTKIVETHGKEREVRSGRVTIRDHAKSLTFTVTIEDLSAQDAGPYWCRIQTVWILDIWSYDPSVDVHVSVFPAPTTVPPTTTILDLCTEEEEVQTHCPGSLLSSTPFLLLVFLKVPLLLIMLSAVLWVNRPLRNPAA
ncbi:CMRF35-like molecule 2 [Erinaceus europaeus]|uniref:CMRF35-like molecule 2 n=1 Tax=Erinaceus europaeus TaxID=9365 RepID=A0A1S2ZVG0_ERIEU|nr:CMRF35-like molecule 2 [Erinaceus europaeus]